MPKRTTPVEEPHMPEGGCEVDRKPPEDEGFVIEVEGPNIIDIGDYCIDCRRFVGEGTSSFASRQPATHKQDDGSYLKGFWCEGCAPLEGTLLEPIIDALAVRRWDERMVRDRMRRVGPEDLYEELVGPMLDMMELLLKLER